MFDAYYWRKEVNKHQKTKVLELLKEFQEATGYRKKFLKEYIDLLNRLAKNNFRINDGAKK